MSFVEIQKGHWGGKELPKDVIRLGNKSLSIAENIAENFQANRRTTEFGNEIVRIGIAVDKEAKQIKLLPGSINGYSWVANSSENGTKWLRTGIPKPLQRLGLEIGDYQIVDRKELVFQLAE